MAFNIHTGKISSEPSSSRVPNWQNLLPFPYNVVDEGKQEFDRIEFALKSTMIVEWKIMRQIYEELEKRVDTLEDFASSKKLSENQIALFLVF